MVVSAPRVETDYLDIFKGYVIISTQRILTRVRQAENLLPANDEKQALHTLSYAFKLPKAWSDVRNLLLAMAPKMEQAGRRDAWMPYLEQGIHQSQKLGDEETAAELQLQLGVLYQLRSEYETARTHLEMSSKGFERLNAPRDQARALNRLAYVARFRRQFEEATRLVDTARRLLGEKDVELAYSFFVLGLVALDKRAWQEAVDFSSKALSLWEQTNDQRMMGRSLITLGAALLPLEEYQEAIDVCQKAIAIFEEIQDPVYKAIAQMHLGNVYLSLEQPLKAMELYLPAKRRFRQVQDQLRLAHINHNIGMAYLQLRQWEKAEEAYLLSIKKWELIGNIERLANSMNGLGLTYLAQSQFTKAQTVFEKALSQLTRIKNEPGYEHWFKILTAHLQQASQEVNHY